MRGVVKIFMYLPNCLGKHFFIRSVISGNHTSGRAVASYTGSLGEGEKRAWYLLFAHALNYLTFQSFWISPGTSVLCHVTSQLAALWTLR